MLNKTQLEAAMRSPLFRGMKRTEIERFLEELRVYPMAASEGTTLIEQGERRSSLHIVLSGAAVGESLGAEGRRVLINEFAPGDLFGDMLSGSEEKSPVAVRMTADGEVLRIPFSALLMRSESCAQTQERVLRNLFGEISSKYFTLMARMELLLCPTLRGKIAKYLLTQSSGERSFRCPHSRERQAEMLGCDRSALSRELSRMRAQGLISFSGAHFELLDLDGLKALF